MALAATAIRPSAARVWWSAVRPVTFAASVAPVLAGTAIGVYDGGTRWAAGIGALPRLLLLDRSGVLRADCGPGELKDQIGKLLDEN